MRIRTPLTTTERLERVRSNILAFHGERIKPGIHDLGTVSICGFGPSLAETWHECGPFVMTTSGAHDFLISRGAVPTYHVETDPREHKIKFLEHSHPDVCYLLNSQCHPRMFQLLRDRNVVMWHGFTDDDTAAQVELIESLEPGTRLLAGGTNVGMRAIIVARELGFTGFDLHGMDCCYRGEIQWAGEHFTDKHRTVIVAVEDEEFETSELMMQSTDDFFNAMRMLPGCKFIVRGSGLLEARLRLFNKDPAKALSTDWWRPISFRLRAA